MSPNPENREFELDIEELLQKSRENGSKKIEVPLETEKLVEKKAKEDQVRSEKENIRKHYGVEDKKRGIKITPLPEIEKKELERKIKERENIVKKDQKEQAA